MSVCPSVRMYVRQVLGETQFSRPLIGMELHYLCFFVLVLCNIYISIFLIILFLSSYLFYLFLLQIQPAKVYRASLSACQMFQIQRSLWQCAFQLSGINLILKVHWKMYCLVILSREGPDTFLAGDRLSGRKWAKDIFAPRAKHGIATNF